MKISLFHLPSFFPEVHHSDAQFYQDMLAETDIAESLGFHSVWFAEHHFYNYGGHLPSVPVIGAAVAQRTKNIRIGSGIALLPLQDPIRIAEEYAMLDCLSGGRLEFGIGRGFQKGEYDAFERDMGDSRALFEEAHDIIMNAWTSGKHSFNGKFRQFKDLTVIPKPIQKPPPVYVACIFTPESFDWTGKMGHTLMVVPYALPNSEMLVDRIQRFLRNRDSNGHTNDAEVLGVFHFYCGDSEQEAKETPRHAMHRYLEAVVKANPEDAYSDQYASYKGLSQAFKTFDYDEYMYPHKVIFGDPDQCVERIRQIREMGVTNVSLIPNFGGLDHEKIMTSLKRFGEYVLPHL